MRSIYETERTLNECQTYIMQLRIDQKSMPPSNKKRELKNRIVEYNSKYYALENKFKKIQLNFKSGAQLSSGRGLEDLSDTDSSSSSGDDEKRLNSSCDMEFEDKQM